MNKSLNIPQKNKFF